MSSADSQFAATESAALRAGALREWLGGAGAGREEVQEELVVVVVEGEGVALEELIPN